MFDMKIQSDGLLVPPSQYVGNGRDSLVLYLPSSVDWRTSAEAEMPDVDIDQTHLRLAGLSQTASYYRPCTAGSCGFAPVPHTEKGPSRQVENFSNGVTFPRYGLHLRSLRAEMDGKAWACQVTDWPSDVTSGCLSIWIRKA